MPVYVDPLRECIPNSGWRWTKSCHLFADTKKELHDFAKRLGLRRSWFQNHPKLPHYDLTIGKRLQAVRFGAVEVSFTDVAERMKRNEEVNSGKT